MDAFQNKRAHFALRRCLLFGVLIFKVSDNSAKQLLMSFLLARALSGFLSLKSLNQSLV